MSSYATPSTLETRSFSRTRVARHGLQKELENCTRVARSPRVVPICSAVNLSASSRCENAPFFLDRPHAITAVATTATRSQSAPVTTSTLSQHQSGAEELAADEDDRRRQRQRHGAG